MPKPAYPFAETPGGPGAIYWRNRHTSTGDTTPPTYPGGVPSLTTRIMLHEGAPSGDGGGVYDSRTRGVGLGEAPTSAAINRGLYDVRCALDMLFEKDNAELAIVTGVVVSGGGPSFLIDTAGFAADNVAYLGRGGTTPTTGPDPELWCSNYLKVWGPGAQGPVHSDVTGSRFDVIDVFDSSATQSLYTNLPADADVYPMGTPGVIDIVGAGTVTFVGAAAPSGTVAGPAVYQCFFNYTQFERELATGGDLKNAFSTALTVAAGVYTMDRVIAGLGWAHGDYVYLTHFAYNPQLSMPENYAPGVESAFIYGSFWTAGWGNTPRFLDFLRFAGVTPTFTLPLTMTEPAAATLRSFDYANSLFRAQDGTLRGTVGYDVKGSSDRWFPPAGSVTEDMYAGFLHRKHLTFNEANNTVLSKDALAQWDAAGNVTLNVPPPGTQFCGAGAVTESLIFPGVDLVELTDATGIVVALLIIASIANQSGITTLELDGTAPVLTPELNGSINIYRPQLRTGIWDTTGTLSLYATGTLLVGDSDETAPAAGHVFSAINALSLGMGDILTGLNTGASRRCNAATDNTLVRVARITSGGDIEFAGDYIAGPATARARFTGAVDTASWADAGPPIRAGESWSTNLGCIVENAVKGYEGLHAFLHYLETTAPAATLSTNMQVHETIAAGDRCGYWMGFPGYEYPLGMVAGGSRDAGFLYTHNAAGSLQVGLGFTTAGSLVRYASFNETPTTRNPPPGPAPPVPMVAGTYGFGANPARLEIDMESTFGWQGEKAFYHHIQACVGEPKDRTEWVFSAPGAGAVVYWRATGLGKLAEADGAIVFPLNIPEWARIETVDLKYEMAVAGGGAFNGRGIQLEVFVEDLTWGGAGPAGAASLMAAPGYVESPRVTTGGVGADLTFTATTPPGLDLVDNRLYQYYIRVVGAYDSVGGVGTLTNQTVYGLRVKYHLVDMLPA